VQARIDPKLLFDMLDAVRLAYETDAQRAEHLLDELIGFLRAALPRLRSASSTVAREVELARAFTRIRTLSRSTEVALTVDIPIDMLDASFPPGVLLPLLDDTLRGAAAACRLSATRQGSEGCVVLTLPTRPSEEAAQRVRSLLSDLHGSAAELLIDSASHEPFVAVKVPYELA
jgi:hypothetical protein